MFHDLTQLKALLKKSGDDAAYARAVLKDRLDDLRSRFGLNRQGQAELAEIETILNN